ncbi:hypothetical protein INT45_013589 [Circinella minor]|uniref:RRM domain-containing protein n=1 Tax=Circinella minor TaxID=1195481 RepID=A0A8H7RPR3_9FUNG|nr:hypothetical protein INT45_013589 [Circinella minor]
MSEEFDIYGDDTFGSEIQSDDILGEIVGESTPQNRQSKKRKPASQNPEDDLFEDFGEIDKETKSTKVDHRSTATSSRQTSKATTLKSTNESISSSHIPTVSSSSSALTNTDQGQRQQTPQTPQKIPSGVQPYNRSVTDSPSSSSASRRELPVSMSNLRGMVSHPTTGLYIGELAWYVNDEDVKAPLVEGGVINDLKDLTFYEHKVNGKSRGICFLEFNSTDSAVKAKELYDKCEIDGKTSTVSFTTSQNPFKHIPKEPVPKSQRAPQQQSQQNQQQNQPHHHQQQSHHHQIQQRENRMNTSGPQMMSGGFNPMMAAAGGFNPAFANMGGNMGAGMGMSPYGSFNPMAAAAAAARGGFYDNMMGMTGTGGGRGGRGGMRGAGQPYMGRMGGRGGPMMGGAGNAAMSGNGGKAISFFLKKKNLMNDMDTYYFANNK